MYVALYVMCLAPGSAVQLNPFVSDCELTVPLLEQIFIWL